jgi:hypothetical protein
MTSQKFISTAGDSVGSPSNNIVFYDSKGKETKNEEHSAAKIVKYSDMDRFYLKAGGPSLDSYNPIIDRLDKGDSRVRGSILYFRHVEVDKGVFDKYIDFLSTRNTYLLNQVEASRKR